MLLPSIFGEDLFNDWAGFSRNFDKAFLRTPTTTVMKTDVKEKEDSYELSIDLPGFSKEDIEAEIKDGYLTVSASHNSEENEEKDGVYIRRERYSGSMSRSFYVGEDMTEEDIKARFENGILTVDVPKEQPKKIEDTRRIVAIA